MMKIFHGHLVLASTFVYNFVAIGAFNCAGLYIGPLSESFPTTSIGTLALYCTIQIVAGLLSSLVGGIAQDWLEKRGIGVRWLFFIGGVFMALGFVWSSLASSMIGVLLGALFLGIGIGFGGFMAGGICILWFEAARGVMLLLAMSGQGVGNVFFAWATAKMLETYEVEDAWRPTMRWMGLVCFVLCALAAFPMRMPAPGEVEKYEQGGETTEEEEKKGGYGSIEAPAPTGRRKSRGRQSVTALENVREQTGHGRRQSTMFQGGAAGGPGGGRKKQRASMMLGSFAAMSHAPVLGLEDVTSDEAGGDDEDFTSLLGGMMGGKDEAGYTLKDVTWTKTNIYLNIFSFVACFAILNMLVLLPPYVASLGMPPSIGGTVIVMFGIGDFLSNITLGVVADAIGARRLLALAFLILSTLFFAWPHCSTGTSLSVIAFFDGYLTCTITSMPIIILADAFSETSSEHILALNGMTNMVKFPGYLLGPVVAGQVVKLMGGDYKLAAITSGLITMFGAIMLLMIPSPEEQQRQLEAAKSKS